MDNISLHEMPVDALVWRCDIQQPAAGKGFFIPAGFEAVVYYAGDYQGPYREGDKLVLPKSPGFFKRKFPTDVSVFFCRKQLPKPLYWGLGELPAPDGGIFGASGQLRLSLSNARMLARQMSGSQVHMGDAELTRCLETLVVENIRPVLIRQVAIMGIQSAKAELDVLSKSVVDALSPKLEELGLSLSSLLVENLLHG